VSPNFTLVNSNPAFTGVKEENIARRFPFSLSLAIDSSHARIEYEPIVTLAGRKLRTVPELLRLIKHLISCSVPL